MSPPLLILGLGQTEFLVILVVVLLLFGASAIPKLARSLGKAQGEFKKAKSEFDSELQKGKAEADAEAAQEEARVRKAAREMGIEEEGMPLADVKKALNEKLS